MISASFIGRAAGGARITPARTKAALRAIAADMDKPDGAFRSASGWTVSLAINYCEAKRIPYRLTAYPGAGYHIERLAPLDLGTGEKKQ